MTRRQQYEALASWAESAEGPDREKDAEFWLFVKPGVTRRQWSYTHTASGKECHFDETRDETGRLIIVCAFTSCLTTLTAVIGEVLPGVDWHAGTFKGRGTAMLMRPDGEAGQWISAATPALALFAALCRALASKESSHTDR